VRIEYRLTEKGRALLPVVEAVAAWAEEWIPAAAG
ncbi:MAG: winged helix-turn-helix transcriptional regulator, partial [Dehalococcoidia bacterium]|nr:winged helix-turn-helix transcriptional regulator [Dehalococcoidia bacterium]